jgi:nitrite reductase/ring-hydroxylating ferredoxin subunit
MRKLLVGRVGELASGTSKKFLLNREGAGEVEAMLLNFDGKLYAYVNRCRHVGISLDWVENQFFTTDGRYLICANHGALYEPTTGGCVWGPCAGQSLHALAVEIDGERVFVRCPEDL